MLETGSGLTVVCTAPFASVMRSVATVGVGVTSGKAVTFKVWVTPFGTSSISGEYAAVARSPAEIGDVGTEVLNR